MILKIFSNLGDLRLLKVVRGKLAQGGVTKGGGTRNLPFPLLSAALHLAILRQSLLVLIYRLRFDRISAITIRELGSAAGILYSI